MKRLRFAFGRFAVTLRVARRRATRRLVKAGLRCPECKGKGVVVNCELVEFIEEIGLPAYYASMILAHRADQIGHDELGSPGGKEWKDKAAEYERIASQLRSMASRQGSSDARKP